MKQLNTDEVDRFLEWVSLWMKVKNIEGISIGFDQACTDYDNYGKAKD